MSEQDALGKNRGIEILKKGSEAFEISLSAQQIEQFVKYHRLLVEWNSFMNLTGIIEFEEVMQKHFVDSLALAGVVDIKNCRRIIDVGTGAGFPGIPLKIAFPELEMVLLDSLNKRVKFLNTVIESLGLTGIQAIHGRAEDIARKPEYRENFDLAVSRAVANLSSLSEYCIPFVKVKGSFIPYKSGTIEEEVQESKKALHVLGGTLRGIKKFMLPDSEIERSFILIEKTSHTDKKYPRKAGLPTKEPIK